MIDVPMSRQRDRRLLGDEEARVLAAADPYTKDLIVAALETGCRGGELQSLQWHDCAGRRSRTDGRENQNQAEAFDSDLADAAEGA